MEVDINRDIYQYFPLDDDKVNLLKDNPIFNEKFSCNMTEGFVSPLIHKPQHSNKEKLTEIINKMHPPLLCYVNFYRKDVFITTSFIKNDIGDNIPNEINIHQTLKLTEGYENNKSIYIFHGEFFAKIKKVSSENTIRECLLNMINPEKIKHPVRLRSGYERQYKKCINELLAEEKRINRCKYKAKVYKSSMTVILYTDKATKAARDVINVNTNRVLKDKQYIPVSFLTKDNMKSVSEKIEAVNESHSNENGHNINYILTHIDDEDIKTNIRICLSIQNKIEKYLSNYLYENELMYHKIINETREVMNNLYNYIMLVRPYIELKNEINNGCVTKETEELSRRYNSYIDNVSEKTKETLYKLNELFENVISLNKDNLNKSLDEIRNTLKALNND